MSQTQFAVVNKNGLVLDDHGTVLIFDTRAQAEHYLQPHIRAWLKQQFGRTWLAPYVEKRKRVGDPAYAHGKGEEIKEAA